MVLSNFAGILKSLLWLLYISLKSFAARPGDILYTETNPTYPIVYTELTL